MLCDTSGDWRWSRYMPAFLLQSNLIWEWVLIVTVSIVDKSELLEGVSGFLEEWKKGLDVECMQL